MQEERPTLYTLLKLIFHQILLAFAAVGMCVSAVHFIKHPYNTGNKYTQFIRDYMPFVALYFVVYFMVNPIRILGTALKMFINKLGDLDRKSEA